MRLRNLYFWLFLFSPLLILGQIISDEYVTAENVKAAGFNRDGKFEEAEEVLNDLLRLLEDLKASDKYFSITFQTKAKVVQNLGRYDESSVIARKSLRLSLKLKDSFNIADSYNTIGVNHYFLSDYDSTSFYYEKSFAIKKKIKTDEYALAVSAYNLAIVFEDLGQFENALRLYKEARELLLKSDRKKNFLSDVYVGLAHLSFYSGDVQKAEEYAEKAMDVGIESYGEFNPNMTFVYVSYANILESQKKYAESITLLEKSLKIRKSAYGENHRWTCEAHYDLANSYFLNEDYAKAEVLYKKAMEIGEEINSTQYLANAKVYLARLYLKKEINLDQAEDLLLQALDRNVEIYGPQNEIVADNHYYLADLQRIKNNEKRFFEEIENILKASNYNSDSIQNVMAPFQALDAFVLMGDWYEKKFKESAKLEYLQKSFELLDKKVEIIKYSQKNFSSDRSKINLANEYREVFEKGLNLCWQLYHKTEDHIYLEKAFELSETNRNTTLLKGLQDVKFKLYAEIPQADLYIEDQVKEALEKVKMDLYYEKTASKPDKDNYSMLLSKRIFLSNKLDSIYDSFALNYPKYSDLKYGEERIKTIDIQQYLEDNTQLITYFLGENHLYSFTLTNESIRFLRGDVSQKLIKKTNTFSQKLSKRESIEDLSKDLYLLLLGQQLDESRKNVIIIADNVLNYLPFEILQKQNGEYLIENHCVSYQGSSRLFLELKSDFFDYKLPQTWAGFSPFYKNENILSSSLKEIEEIQELVGGVKFIGDRASKANFLKNNRNFSVLHLAMHAEVNDNNPQDNKLLFEDGELTASEIYVSNSMANMAVLSACNTGFGKIERGEGVMSMARAFHFSGIPSVVMSLWKVPDKETKKIMINFYEYLKRGVAKNEALRLAKLDFLNSTTHSELRHPYYWSGFVVNGDTSPIILGKNNSYFLWIAVIVLMLAMLGYRLKKGS